MVSARTTEDNRACNFEAGVENNSKDVEGDDPTEAAHWYRNMWHTRFTGRTEAAYNSSIRPSLQSLRTHEKWRIELCGEDTTNHLEARRLHSTDNCSRKISFRPTRKAPGGQSAHDVAGSDKEKRFLVTTRNQATIGCGVTQALDTMVCGYLREALPCAPKPLGFSSPEDQ